MPPESPLPRALKIYRGLSDPLSFLSSLEKQFGDIVTLRRGHSYAVFHPDYIKHVLQDNHPNYGKGERYRAALAPLMGNGLFTSEGQFWLRQRRLAQAAFQRAHLASFGVPIAIHVSDLIAKWHDKARHGTLVALREELTDLTLRIALQNLFSADAEKHIAALVEAAFGVNEEIKLGAAFLPFKIPHWVPTPGRRRFARSLKAINDFVYGVIGERRKAASAGEDFAGLFIAARDRDVEGGMDDVQVRDELVTILNAGHDTVTDSIVWTMVLLSRHPETKEAVRSEVIRLAGAGPVTVESVLKMELLGRVFHESLRLYPPGWAFARTALHHDSLGEFAIPAGALVVISPYVVHRSSRFWNNPERFDPDRFLPGPSAGRQKFTYFPFGAGPRQCIGASLAMMEAPLILASILQRCDFQILNPAEVKPEPRISLRPKGSVWMRVIPLSV
jgi:cytochrome P450